ncbi:SH3 domain-containing protein [Sandarakinorhabdus limnophila]|uniref:SH3 domain-containing protein n=1 Tax=Sandarakinorhabdus limnophila TaxID=210512 RepID=UPI0026EC73DB|nr:SH3 domain-containing protein [Sandarakinorhabdus limnophila]
MKTALILLIACAATAANAAEFADGTTDLPKPRFVSIKGGSAMMRSGPGERFPILWEYKRPGLPMEILKEYEIWRQVRDPDGTIGWMNKALLTGQRTGMVRDQSRLLYVAPDMKSRIAWRIAPGTVVNITLCEDIWCRVSKDGKSGYILRGQMWGTGAREKIEG